ncbi:hypothetical protein JL100_000360 [Skermanella mucosa]|uniref:hypothetical protein n=1 Tax=Skermanella mucosa TaxID=1789672 RepID=UPI00192BDF26|nr:hypothetical protein [Skermanella mucosa]UEM21283.1 hypothetical protein JL100_000360 [Skermanella mucosa]
MPRDINNRIEQLRTRRAGMDRLERLNEQARYDVLAKSLVPEPWQKRVGKPHTKYALGAMQEVDADYTRISIETAERVGRQLDAGLTTAGFSVEFRLQGSVPLNVHIRGVSDVDLLNLETGFLTYDTGGARSAAGQYRNPTIRTSVDVLSNLRREAERILKNKYPATTVDTSGGKAISISGGSLARPVDVVPSHWHDTIDYQRFGQEHDRGVTILDKKVPEALQNLPFLHIKRVGERDEAVMDSLRKAIRLCKNLKSDANEEGRNVNLPSFDIAATMYHANLDALRSGAVYELGILAEAQRHLDFLARNVTYAATLTVPDGSRRIFNTGAKIEGLIALSIEIDELAREVAKEQNSHLATYDAPPLDVSRAVLSSIYVP